MNLAGTPRTDAMPSGAAPTGHGAGPTMVPSSRQVSERMSRVVRRDTGPELALRKALHARGLRYRVDRVAVKGMRSRPDIVFGPARVAVYVDGCFWHGCPVHGTAPRANKAFWADKLDRNRRRDQATDEALRKAGWEPVRVWEHEPASEAAERVAAMVRHRIEAAR